MTEKYENSIAFIVKTIQEISGKNPGKKTLQKLVFLVEQKGIDIGCEYGLHFYGPYSATVDEITAALNADGVISFDYSAYSHKMSVNDGFDIKSEISSDQENILFEVLSKYKDWSPSQLELLTTAIYAYDNLDDKTKESVINGVVKIKGEKYSKDDIENVFKEFEYFNKAI